MGDLIPNPPPSVLRLFFKMGGTIVVFAGFLFAIFSLVGHFVLLDAERFETDGRYTNAMVTRKRIEEGRDSEGNRELTYYLGLSYVTQRKEEIRVDRSVSRNKYRDTDVGDEIEIRYLASTPRRTEITPGEYRNGARILSLVSLAIGLVWLWLVWLIGGWAVAAVRARRYGKTENVQVHNVRATSTKVNGRPRYRLIWYDSNGKMGQSLQRRKSGFRSLEKGDEITIYHGLKYTWWAGDVGLRTH
ncbi:MAG: DUF3592 domain-containing protein [Pseudomonadota bacterium]